MRILFICVFVSIAASTLAQTDEEIQAYKVQCIKDSNVDTSLIQRGEKLDFVDDDQPLKNFFHCFFTSIGFQDKDGNMVADAVAMKVDEDKKDRARALAIKCGDIKATKEDTAYESWKCFLTQAGDIKVHV